MIPVLKGTTKPNASVFVTVSKVDGEDESFEVMSDENGMFTFIPDGTFKLGVYDISAIATDQFGAKSDPSDPIRIIVEDPGYIQIGSLVISILSILIPLVALCIILVFGMWYLWHRLMMWRKRVYKETIEAEEKLKIEFDAIVSNLSSNVAKLKKARKGKLTKAESALIDQLSTDIRDARTRIKKEVSDIEDIVK